MTLYNIDKILLHLLVSAVDENGEISPDFEDKLNEMGMVKDEKILNIACFIKNLKADVLALKNEEDVLKQRRKVIENQIKRNEKYISESLGEGNKLEDSRVKLSWRKSEKTIITSDIKDIPSQFCKITKEANLTLIKMILKEKHHPAMSDNWVVEKHARIQTTQNLQIK